MICELYNKIEKYGSSTFGTQPHYKDEISLTNILCQIMYGIAIIIFVIWWLIPLRKIGEYMDNVTFKCDKDKIRGK